METHKDPDWVHRLTATILLCMLLYLVIGIPDFHRDTGTSASTDAINPFNRFIWLALLAVSLPLVKMKWVDILQALRACWPLVILFLYFSCSTTWALDPDSSRRRILFAWIQIILVATLTCTLRNRVLLIRFAFLSCLCAAVADLAAWVLMPGYAMTSEGLAGIQLQKNVTGLVMMYGLLAGTTLLFCRPSQRERWLTLGGLGLLFLVLLASRSKTCLGIVLTIPSLLWLFFILVRSRWATTVALTCAGIGGAIGVGFGYLIWCNATNSDPIAPFSKMTFTSRADIWTFMVGQIEQRPWLGAGFYSFWAINPNVQPSLKTSMWFGSEAHINEAHNGYLDLLATGGIVGFIWGVGVLLYALSLATKAIARTHALGTQRPTVMPKPVAFFHLGFLLALSIHNFTESNLFSNNSLLAVALYFSLFDLTYWNWRQAMHDPARKEWERWSGASTPENQTAFRN